MMNYSAGQFLRDVVDEIHDRRQELKKKDRVWIDALWNGYMIPDPDVSPKASGQFLSSEDGRKLRARVRGLAGSIGVATSQRISL
jgi:hypothetical protein